MDGLSLLLGLALVVTPIYGVRITFYGLPIYLPEIFILLAGLYWFIRQLVRPSRISWPPLLVTLPTLVFLIGATLSTQHAGLSSAYGALKSWVVVPIAFGFLAYQALRKDQRSRNYLEISLLSSAVVVSLYGIVTVLLHGGRLESFFNSPNSAAMWLVPIFFILLGRRREKSFLVGLVIMFIGILLTRSLSGVLALLIGLAAMWLVSRAKTSNQERVAWSLPSLGVAAFALFSVTSWLNDISSAIFGERLGGRSQIWEVGRMAVRENWLFGIGPDVFQRYYFARVGLLFPNPVDWTVPEPHNLYLATWLSSGVIGLAGFLALIFSLFYQQIKTRQPALFGALVAILVHGLTDTPYWKNDLSIIFFLIVALTCSVSPETSNK